MSVARERRHILHRRSSARSYLIIEGLQEVTVGECGAVSIDQWVEVPVGSLHGHAVECNRT